MILIETYSNPVHDLPTDTLIAPLFVSLPVPLHCVQGELDMTNMDVALNMEALVQNRGGPGLEVGPAPAALRAVTFVPTSALIIIIIMCPGL